MSELLQLPGVAVLVQWCWGLRSWQFPCCVYPCRWLWLPTLLRPPSPSMGLPMSLTVALWSSGPTTPKQPSNASWWCRCPKLQLTREQAERDATALGSATGFTQVRSSRCKEGELAAVTCILVYSGFSVRERTKKRHFVALPVRDRIFPSSFFWLI